MTQDEPDVRCKVGLTGKGWSLVVALGEAECVLASIWREPFETYPTQQRMDWMDRQKKAARVYLALMNQI